MKINITPIAICLCGVFVVGLGALAPGLDKDVRQAIIGVGSVAFGGAAGLARSDNNP
jgi:hypothetical protein